MRLITKQHLANITKDRWKAQYYKNGEWYAYGGDKEVKYNNLVALGDKPSPDDVNEVIGNNSWTNITCSECGESVNSAVELGEVGYDTEYVYACKDCLTKALGLF
jgi:hypothetical protein